MGGVGKTTLAKTWYHRLTHPANRTKHHFVSDISENCKTRSGVENLVQQLYSTLLCENNLSLKDLDLDHTRGRLSRMKVVVVLDNVETPWQLEQLLLGEILDPTKLFGPGSVLIITSRNQRVFDHERAKTHKVEELDSDESLELFSIHAFRQLCPHNDFMNHSRLAASYCKGNPLALKLLGGALFGKDKEYWKSFFYGLEKNSKPEIHDVLSTSYYALKEEEQRIFLDVACFLFNTAKTRMIKYLSTSYSSAYSLVENLIDKSLVFPVTLNNKCYEIIVVHDLLKEMAWNIVNNEKLVELDLFDCPNLTRLPTKLNSKCLNLLRLSKCPKVTNCPEINAPPEGGLETLDLEETPVRVMPSAIHKVKEGGIIRLYGKHITSFPRISKRLKLLRLCHTTIKDMEHVDNDHDRGLPLSRFDRLELHENSKLASLADNIWDMVKHQLWVHGSPLIECLPPESLPCTSIDQLENLRVLHLSYCLMLECIPDNIHKLANLYLLNLRGSTRIETLPQLLPPKLDSLSISGCKSLRALPSHAGKLKWWVLRIENCPRLDNELPGQISQDFDSCATVSSRAKVITTHKFINIRH
ncbi:Disease resistance-like protein DSC1 [Linum perenne]